MDYLKFLGVTAFAVLVIGLGVKFIGINISPARYSVGFIIWLVTAFLWLTLIQVLVSQYAAQISQKFSPAEIRISEGFWFFVGIVLLHPVCYGLARLLLRRLGYGNSRAATQVRLTERQGIIPDRAVRKPQRHLILIFVWAALVVLFVGDVLEHMLHIPSLPYEYYLVLCALACGIASAAYVARKPSNTARNS